MESEGEVFIAEFLQSKNIKYRREEKIDWLKNDSKSYRMADFYLPRYNVYIEFFGLWNNEKDRVRYQDKKNIYNENKVACIYLYPENLGVIDYIFHKRLIEVLTYNKMEKEVDKYRFDILKKARTENILGIIVCSLLLIPAWPWTKDSSKYFAVLMFLVIGYQIYLITKSITLIYRGKDPVKLRYFEKD
jgi:hypothetical protein